MGDYKKETEIWVPGAGDFVYFINGTYDPATDKRFLFRDTIRWDTTGYEKMLKTLYRLGYVFPYNKKEDPGFIIRYLLGNEKVRRFWAPAKFELVFFINAKIDYKTGKRTLYLDCGYWKRANRYLEIKALYNVGLVFPNVEEARDKLLLMADVFNMDYDISMPEI